MFKSIDNVMQNFDNAVFNVANDAMFGYTANNVEQQENTNAFSLESLQTMLDNLEAKFRASYVGFLVNSVYEGPPLIITDGPKGKEILCSYKTAKEVHDQFPLQLVKIFSPTSALFEVATIMPGLIFTPLYPPPFIKDASNV